MKIKNYKLSALAITVALSAVACSPVGHHAKNVASSSVENLGCKTSQSEMWNSLHQVAEEDGKYPEPEELKAALTEIGKSKGLTGKAFDHYVDAFVNNYAIIVAGIKEKFAPTDIASWKKALAEMEIGIRTTEIHAELQSKIELSLSELSQAENALQATCSNDGRNPAGETDPIVTPDPESTPAPAKPSTVWEQLAENQNPEVVGARKVLATLYQSCDVLAQPAMTANTSKVTGITILSKKNPINGGKLRVYGSVSSIDSSHYYIKNNRLPKNSCYEVRNSPPIYDYGGKPYTTSSLPKVLNMFKNGGSGSEALGIDCSAYVFSSLALAGLKLDPSQSKPLKADLVLGVGSKAFKEPQANGLRCLEKISVSKTKSVEAGDIVAINGHVVMIDQVGEDPFGLDRITSSADCNSSKILSSHFDFVIAQSSPSKDGIGVNRYAARDYLSESSTIRTGLTNYAVAACRAKFGLSATVNSPNLSVVRHKKTAECTAEPLVATHEDCVDSCQAI